ncbi:MAG: HAD family hydrolase, partial [Candidatus Hodarchaeales archaeon]
MDVIDFNTINTLLFDIDNTLIIFDEQKFVHVYSKLIYEYFKEEILDFNKFVNIFLASTHKMLDKDPPNLTNMEKFAKHFSLQLSSLTAEEIWNRFFLFYHKDFQSLKEVVRPNPLAKKVLKLASKQFDLVAATNPLFPTIANEIRLDWGGI